MMCRLYKCVYCMFAATLNYCVALCIIYFNAHCVWMVTESGVLCCCYKFLLDSTVLLYCSCTVDITHELCCLNCRLPT